MQLECPVSLSGDHISWPLFQGKKNSIQVLPLRRHDDIKHFQRRAITSSKGGTGLYPQRRKPWAASTWGHPHVPQTFVSSGRGRNITMVTQRPDCSKDQWFPTEESSFAIDCSGNQAGPYLSVVLLQDHYLCYDFLLSSQPTNLKTIHLMWTEHTNGQGASNPGAPWSPLSPLDPLEPFLPLSPCK